MYRTLLCVAYVSVVSAAPPTDGDSGVTFIKTLPFDRLKDEAQQPRSPFRESRIELLPLTIPGNITKSSPQSDKLSAEKQEISAENSSKIAESSEQEVLGFTGDHNFKEVNRNVRSEATTESESETTIDTTELVERDEKTDAVLRQTEEYESRTRAPTPRFLSKLSYFKHQDEDKSTSIFTNLVERTSKKKFRSKCRCEKIWNCPKLQITVPRCPNEYFLCCF